ncbi:MAG: hypothetical protein WC333_01970 [Dehalococcoidia bacterium]|jgi:predicted  nucleic acid-binding Zn-ribbon protein
MLNTKKSLHELIMEKYECQKRISINSHHIHDLRQEGKDTTKLMSEIENMKHRITCLNREMEDKYSYSCHHITV